MVDWEKPSALISPEESSSFLNQSSEVVFLDADTEGRLNDKEAAERINVLCHLTAATEFSFLPIETQSRYLRQLQQERCSIRQLARLTGLAKGQIERLLKQRHKRTVPLSPHHLLRNQKGYILNCQLATNVLNAYEINSNAVLANTINTNKSICQNDEV